MYMTSTLLSLSSVQCLVLCAQSPPSLSGGNPSLTTAVTKRRCRQPEVVVTEEAWWPSQQGETPVNACGSGPGLGLPQPRAVPEKGPLSWLPTAKRPGLFPLF